MKNFKIYLDTSVISMLDNSLRGIVTQEFFEFATQSGCEYAISGAVKAEIDNIAANTKKEEISQFIETLNCVFLPNSKEAQQLAWSYVKDGILTENHIVDLTHVAFATVFGCDMIVSWNRKHIAKPIKIQKINTCNLKNNYNMIAIYTPQEFLTSYK
ncbi:MAG: hypothetical protein LBU34_13905 [Planctomycetaceae bacterium]|jgi:hypothetical protein|nr:hypothetical protein [Planctomycetaceae bacterium]